MGLEVPVIVLGEYFYGIYQFRIRRDTSNG
jgi:hypothetical protein